MMVHSNGESLRLRLVEIRDQLEISQRCLTGYLDTKRQAFPRMFFVSDTILLESLSYTLEADAMKPLLIPLFDNVRSLMLHEAKPSLLVGIVSEEGEELVFDAPVPQPHRNNCQIRWKHQLTAVCMVSSTQRLSSLLSSTDFCHGRSGSPSLMHPQRHTRCAAGCCGAGSHGGSRSAPGRGSGALSASVPHANMRPRHAGSLMHPGPDQIQPPTETLAGGRRGHVCAKHAPAKRALLTRFLRSEAGALPALRADVPCSGQFWLSGLCGLLLSRGEELSPVASAVQTVGLRLGQRLHDASITAGERRKLPALLIMYTAQRDAVAELMRCKVREPEEFEWQRQQRFAWREHDKAALAETAGHALPYGFEFVGARRRLVPNAGTVRSFVFAVQAMAAWSCAVLAGPPGCGKTETMKELARLLGRFSLDLTCSSEITYATVTSMLAGLCHSGAWGCFDRIGCLPEGVLSVVAQQLSAVLAAQRGGAWRGAWTDGKAFTLQPTTAFFVPPPPSY